MRNIINDNGLKISYDINALMQYRITDEATAANEGSLFATSAVDIEICYKVNENLSVLIHGQPIGNDNVANDVTFQFKAGDSVRINLGKVLQYMPSTGDDLEMQGLQICWANEQFCACGTVGQTFAAGGSNLLDDSTLEYLDLKVKYNGGAAQVVHEIIGDNTQVGAIGEFAIQGEPVAYEVGLDTNESDNINLEASWRGAGARFSKSATAANRELIEASYSTPYGEVAYRTTKNASDQEVSELRHQVDIDGLRESLLREKEEEE